MFTTDFVSDMLKAEVPQQEQQKINIEEIASTISLKMENMLKQRLEEFEKKILSQSEPKAEEPKQEEPKQEEPKTEE